MSVVRLNENTLFSMGFDRVSIEALRHFLRQVGELTGGATLPDVAAVQEMLQIDAAFLTTPGKQADSINGAFQDGVVFRESDPSGVFDFDRPQDLSAVVAELVKQVSDLRQQLLCSTGVSGQVAELQKYAQHLEVAYAIAPLQPCVDWARPGRIGSLSANTGAFTALSSTGVATLNGVTVGGGTSNYYADATNAAIRPTSSGAGAGIYFQNSAGAATWAIVTVLGIQVTAGFGCNGKTPQTAVASGAVLNAYGAGANGLAAAADMQALVDKVIAIDAACKANGILS